MTNASDRVELGADPFRPTLPAALEGRGKPPPAGAEHPNASARRRVARAHAADPGLAADRARDLEATIDALPEDER